MGSTESPVYPEQEPLKREVRGMSKSSTSRQRVREASGRRCTGTEAPEGVVRSNS